MGNGDLNLMGPKFLAFASPHHTRCTDGYPTSMPEDLFEVFRQHGVTDIVRLNKVTYDSERFKAGGFQFHDLFFTDGSVPPDDIVDRFLAIAEAAKGRVAVHCKAGLGRTGTLIALYHMKHNLLTAQECIGWLRLCRPGSVLGPQQGYLCRKQAELWARAPPSAVRLARYADPDADVRAQQVKAARERQQSDAETDMDAAIAATFNAAEADTQGDYLTQRKNKAQQQHHATAAATASSLKPPPSPTSSSQVQAFLTMPQVTQVSS